jgi:NAD(P)-dependent dehydrogenase (short-subunit alcohol dehydrogenase family)
MFRLDGRSAIVTGASSGLGVQFAEALRGAGANVVIAARRADRLEKVAAEIPGVVPVTCDVTRDDHCRALVDQTVERFGTVDVLVNNAGATSVGPAEEESLETFRTVVEANLTSVLRLSQLAGRQMIAAGRGSIVNISSILGLVGVGQIPQSAYVASKTGLVGLTRELAAQWARKGVRVNAIAPGFFESEMTEDMTTNEDAGLRWIRGKAPMGRPGLAGELNGALLFLASDASSYVTGHTIPVDGGWTAV